MLFLFWNCVILNNEVLVKVKNGTYTFHNINVFYIVIKKRVNLCIDKVSDNHVVLWKFFNSK